MIDISCRDYRPDDFQACLEVFDTNVPRFFSAEERDEYTDFMRKLPGPYLLLTDTSRRVVGCGGYAVRTPDRTADLCWGMVRGDLHGKGIGRILVQARLDSICREPDVEAVVLNTSQHTAAFYERFGFETISVQPGGYAPGLDRYDMRLKVR